MIHDLILEKVRDELQIALVDNIYDDTRAGIVQLGDLQGEPTDPDEARISVTLHENDPDKILNISLTGMNGDWSDEVLYTEIGGATNWKRRFTVKARCLLDSTQEDLDNARRIASTVRTRIEHTLPTISFSGVQTDNEYVSRRIVSSELRGEMLQAGGPPDSFDFFIKIRFDVWTTEVYDIGV